MVMVYITYVRVEGGGFGVEKCDPVDPGGCIRSSQALSRSNGFNNEVMEV